MAQILFSASDVPHTGRFVKRVNPKGWEKSKWRRLSPIFLGQNWLITRFFELERGALRLVS